MERLRVVYSVDNERKVSPFKRKQAVVIPVFIVELIPKLRTQK